MSQGEYIIKIGNELKTYTDFNDIPDKFDHIIKFLPEIPEGPHTHEEHELIESFNDIFQSLMEGERNASSH
jgi:hypothetical protein